MLKCKCLTSNNYHDDNDTLNNESGHTSVNLSQISLDAFNIENSTIMEVQAISGISTVNSNISHSLNDSADMRDSMRPSTVCSYILMHDSTLEGND